MLRSMEDTPRGHSATDGPVRVRTAVSGRYRIRVRSRGPLEGPAAILLPGMGAGAYVLAPQVRALRRLGYTTHVVELPGFGLAPPLRAADAHFARLAEHVIATARALGIERALLLGHSLGGGVALYVALMAPDLAERLVLAAPAAVGRSLSWTYRLLSLPLVGSLLLRPYTRGAPGVLRRFLVGRARRDDARFLAALVRRDRRPLEVALSMRAIIRANQPRGRSWLRCLVVPGDEQCGFTLAEHLAEIRHVPTLALWGADDRVVPASHARLLRAAHPAAEIHVAPGMGHLLPVEAPAWCNERIARFAGLAATGARELAGPRDRAA